MIILSNPPSAAQYSKDPAAGLAAFERWAHDVKGALENHMRHLDDPVRAVFTMTNSSAPSRPTSVTLDVASGTLADVRNFLDLMVAALVARGWLRTKAGEL